jgi:hypothetical protein
MADTIECQNCGRLNPADADYCSGCRGPLSDKAIEQELQSSDTVDEGPSGRDGVNSSQQGALPARNYGSWILAAVIGAMALIAVITYFAGLSPREPGPGSASGFSDTRTAAPSSDCIGTWIMHGGGGGTLVLNKDGTGVESGGYAGGGEAIQWREEGDHIVMSRSGGRDPIRANLSDDGKNLFIHDPSGQVVALIRQ